MPLAHNNPNWEFAIVSKGMVDGSGQFKFRVPPMTSWMPLYVDSDGRIVGHPGDSNNISAANGILPALKKWEPEQVFKIPGFLIYHDKEPLGSLSSSLLVRPVPSQNAVMSVVCDAQPGRLTLNISVYNMGGEVVFAKDYAIDADIRLGLVREEVKHVLGLAGKLSRNTHLHFVMGTYQLKGGNSVIWSAGKGSCLRAGHTVNMRPHTTMSPYRC